MRTLLCVLSLVLLLSVGAAAQDSQDSDKGIRVTVAQDVTVPVGSAEITDFNTSNISVAVDMALGSQMYATYEFIHSWLTEMNSHGVSATLDWGSGLTTKIGWRTYGPERQEWFGRVAITFGKLY